MAIGNSLARLRFGATSIASDYDGEVRGVGEGGAGSAVGAAAGVGEAGRGGEMAGAVCTGLAVGLTAGLVAGVGAEVVAGVGAAAGVPRMLAFPVSKTPAMQAIM